MNSRLLSRRDLSFLLYEWLDAESLTARSRYQAHDRTAFDALLQLSEQIATEQFAPHNKRNDAEEPRLDGATVRVHPEVAPAVTAFAEAGLIGAGLDESLGGLQLPALVTTACMAWFQAANVGTSAYPFLTIANVNLLAAHGGPELIETYVEPMLAGRFLGTMCLSEPQAGSSLSDILTRAEPCADGSYRLFGNKMWISGGDHEISENIVHLVLAKIAGGPPGVKGISLFVVPKKLVNADGSVGERNDVTVAGLNHKMGFRGTTNALPNFGEGRHLPGGEPGAVGYLVGEEHRGLTYMFHMMNEARIGVGLMSAALGYTGYLKSLEYARTRPQGRPPQAKSPADPQVPIIGHADVRRMLLAQKAYAEGALALNLYCAKLLDEERSAPDEADHARTHLLLELLTPIAKSWPSQWCLEANDLAIQVHGGYGYTRDYDVEQHYRDNRLNPIHEGTHGIQALDLLGRKVVMDGGAALAALADTVHRSCERASGTGDEELAAQAKQLAEVMDRAVAVTATLWAAGDPERTLANASVYLDALGHVVIAWIWLEQSCVASGHEGSFYRGKRQAAKYFFRWELPKTAPQFELLERLDPTTLEMQDDWF